jgi:hypothetical protein
MKPTLFFLDGTVLGPNSVALAAQYNEYADVDASRVLLKFKNDWLKVDFDDDVIRSMAFAGPSGTLYLLGTSGAIYTVGGGGAQFSRSSIKGTLSKQRLVDPEDRGELFRVRVVGGRVLVCGQGGQLFELLDGVWRSMSLSASALSCPDFEDVTIDPLGRPIAVGLKGAVYLFDGVSSQALDCPTNQHLSSIVNDGSGQCFACGNEGIVLAIDANGFQDLSVGLKPVRNLWAIARHAGSLYVCEPGRMLSRKLNLSGEWEVEPVSSLVGPTFYRLTSNDTELWSFGSDHVFVKRGDDWSHVQIPGNEVPP